MKTYKQIVEKDFPILKKKIENLNEIVLILRKQLTEQNILDPIIFVNKIEANELLLNSIKEIYYCSNSATQAWEIADSCLRKLE